MIEMHELHLQDYVLYKDLSFNFMNGTTVIRGANRSGKSLVFSPLNPLLFNIDKLPTGSRVQFFGDNNGVPFAITGFNHGKSDRFSVEIDGVDQQTDTIAKARAVIDDFFGISESVFNTTVHISGLKDHPLARGKPSDRLDWIQKTLAFSEVFDSYAAIVEADIKRIRELATKHKVLVEELEALESDKPSQPQEIQEVDTDKLKEQIAELYRRSDALLAQQTLPQRPKTKLSLEEIEKKNRKLQARLAQFAEDEKAYNFYLAELKHYNKVQSRNKEAIARVDGLRSKLNIPADISESAVLKGCKKRLDKVKDQIREAKDNNEEFSRQEELRAFKSKKTIFPDKNLMLHAKDFDVVPRTRKDYEKAENILNENISNAKAMLKLSDGECTYCGKDLAKNIPVWETTIRELKKLKELVSHNYMTIQARDTDFTEYVDLEPLEVRKSLLEDIIEALGEVEIVEKPAKIAYDAEQHEKLRELYSTGKRLYKELEEYEDKIKSAGKLLSPEELQLEIKKVRELITRKTDKLTALSEQQVKHATEVALWKKYKQQRKRLLAQISELAKYPKRLKVDLGLRAAFGRDGLRVQRLNETLELFVEQLNSCANLVFSEPFKFDIEVGHRKCDVVAYRNGKKGSIFTASGSERRGWQLVCAMALLQILPNNMRFDSIILDELEANMDDTSKAKFVQDYLPELAKLVPNIIIVTPLSEKELFIPAAYHYKAVKRKGSTQLIKA